MTSYSAERALRHRARSAPPVARVGAQFVARAKIFALVVTAILALGACETTGYSTGGAQGERRAEMLAEDGRHADAAGAYIGLATQARGVEQDRLTLLAVEQWLDAGDGRRARNALSGVAMPQSGEMLWLWSTDSAALALWEGRPDRAMSLLESLTEQPLPADYRARVDALRADAWFQKGDPARATDIYIQREGWLDNPATLERNRHRLWAGLLISDTAVLRSAAESAYDPLVRGWLTLAVLANTTGQQGIGWSNGIVAWQQNYHNHPAATILTDLAQPDDVLLDYPRQIALLLPLSGSYAAAGNAIKNGFLGAYYAAVSGLENTQQIRVYDINEFGGAGQAYNQAVIDGAEFVVGPLIRRSVGDLATEMMLPIPVLALNYVAGDLPAPPGFYQFALSPEDEARSAATRAIAEGHKRAVALVPASETGTRVLQSFAMEFAAQGGTLLDHRIYETAVQDFAFEIEGLMSLTESVQRYNRLRANIGGPLQFDPRRRQDVDLIFLYADAGAGRLIKSQLKFHYSGELPVYATSVIYGLDGRSNSDLNGVMFADTPWTISPPAWIADYPALFENYWPAQRRQTRLHAMGYDAYHLVGNLFGAREQGMDEITGATGQLYLDVDGRVHRKLAWAQFENGVPVSLPDLDENLIMLDEFEQDTGDQGEWREIQLDP